MLNGSSRNLDKPVFIYGGEDIILDDDIKEAGILTSKTQTFTNLTEKNHTGNKEQPYIKIQ